MPAFEAVVRPVDVRMDSMAPQTINLTALVLDRPPGPDGILYDQSNVISRWPVSLRFIADDYRLLSAEQATIILREGVWPKAYLLLIDDAGRPYAQGGVRTEDGLPAEGKLESARNRVTVSHDRRLG